MGCCRKYKWLSLLSDSLPEAIALRSRARRASGPELFHTLHLFFLYTHTSRILDLTATFSWSLIVWLFWSFISCRDPLKTLSLLWNTNTQNFQSQELLFKELKGYFSPLLSVFPPPDKDPQGFDLLVDWHMKRLWLLLTTTIKLYILFNGTLHVTEGHLTSNENINIVIKHTIIIKTYSQQ